MAAGAPRKRRILRVVLLFVVPLGSAAVGLYFYLQTGRFVVTENAYVKANIVAISADVSGRVVWVGATDNSPVHAGQSLFRIDPRPFELAVEEAAAQMEVVRTEIEALRADYREALAEASAAEEQVHFLELQFKRQDRLRRRGIASEERFDQASYDLAAARKRLRVVRERIQQDLASLAGDADLPVERHPRYQRALALRERAAIDLEHTEIVAPADGTVSNMRLQVGEYVETGEPVFSLIEAGKIWVEANLKETQLTHVEEGQSVALVVDAYPDRQLQARVGAIAPATGAEFALLPPQNATGNWVKVVQRVPVVIEIEGAPDDTALRAGMTATVRIDTRHRRRLPMLVEQLVSRGSQRTVRYD